MDRSIEHQHPRIHIRIRIYLLTLVLHFLAMMSHADSSSGLGEMILHQACSKREIEGSGFEAMKNEAFEALESEEGFFDTTYGGVHVVGQCSGFLGACDCGECVNRAVEIASGGDCRFSVSGDVYLEGCFIKYEYDGNIREFGGYLGRGNGRRDNSSKLVAIFVGGLALLSLGIALCCFMRKKKEDW